MTSHSYKSKINYANKKADVLALDIIENIEAALLNFKSIVEKLK